jgi:hypothetical protein
VPGHPGDYVGSYLLSYSIDDPSVVSCEWSEWYDENYIDLDLTALAAGSTNVWIYLRRRTARCSTMTTSP